MATEGSPNGRELRSRVVLVGILHDVPSFRMTCTQITNHNLQISRFHMPTRSEIAATASTYLLLSRLWHREVDEPLLTTMRTGELADALHEISGPATFGGESPSLDTIAVDFCHLFLGPVGHLPPYQSVWAQGTLQGVSASAMRRWLNEYMPSYMPFGGLAADHLAVQFDVMANILKTGLHGDSAPDQTAGIELAERFYHDHVAWSTKLIEMARERARTDFYRDVMTLTEAFLATQLDGLKSHN